MLQLALDNDTRANGGIGAQYTTVTGVGGGGFNIASNKATASTISGDCWSARTAEAYANNHYSLIVFSTIGVANASNHNTGPSVNINPGGGSGYISCLTDANGWEFLWRPVASGAGDVLLDSGSQNFSNGDAGLMVRVWPYLYLYRFAGGIGNTNGNQPPYPTQLSKVTDTNGSNGSPGMFYSSTATTLATLSMQVFGVLDDGVVQRLLGPGLSPIKRLMFSLPPRDTTSSLYVAPAGTQGKPLGISAPGVSPSAQLQFKAARRDNSMVGLPIWGAVSVGKSATQAAVGGSGAIAGLAVAKTADDATVNGSGAVSGIAAAIVAADATVTGKGAIAGISVALVVTNAVLLGNGSLSGTSVAIAAALGSANLLNEQPAKDLRLLGPGVTPNARLQFRQPRRETTTAAVTTIAVQGVSIGKTASMMQLLAQGSVAGVAVAESADRAQLLGGGTLSAISIGKTAVDASGKGSGAVKAIAVAESAVTGLILGSGKLSGVAVGKSAIRAMWTGAGALNGISVAETSARLAMTGVGSLNARSVATAVAFAHGGLRVFISGYSLGKSGALGLILKQLLTSTGFVVVYDGKRLTFGDRASLMPQQDNQRASAALDRQRFTATEDAQRAMSAADNQRASVVYDAHGVVIQYDAKRMFPT